MSQKNKYTLRPISAAVSAAFVTPTIAIAQNDNQGPVLEEVIVTARKLEQNLQEIPASIQAFNEDMLKSMGALNTEDYARFIPSVSFLNFSAAGSNQVIFRGVSTGTDNFIADASASVYLDEISVTQTGSQPNIRMLDVARVEALSGPQGTLYGAAAQAGTMRIITNPPDPSKFSASIDAIMRTGEDSDESYDITGVLNLPIIEDVFAIRIAASSAEDGGFIDNVLGHTPDGWYGYGFPAERSTWGTTDNADVAEKDWNSVDYTNVRISALWNINENWRATAAYNYSETETDAANDYNPFVGDLKTIQFAKNYRKEEFDLYSLTIEGDLGFAQFVSATSYFDRDVDYSLDGTIYYKYYHAWGCEERSDTAYYYWLWVNPGTGNAIYYPKYCMLPSDPSSSPLNLGDDVGVLQGPEWNDKFAQEIRLSHQGETFDWLAGFYYEESEDNWDSVWAKSKNTNYQETLSLAWVEDVYNTTLPDAQYAFLSTDRTDWEQTAVFGEITWHINEEWHATIGGRYFEIDNDKTYIKYYAGTTQGGNNTGGVRQPGYGPGEGGDDEASGDIDEFVPKFSLAWNFADDKMAYALYSEGYRTGGINRSNGSADWNRTVFSQTFDPDKLSNYELGLRSQWLDNTLQVNLTGFYMDWEDYQLEVVDPSFLPCDGSNEPFCDNAWLKVVGNAGDAHTAGVQTEIAWVPSVGWDIGGNAMWLEAEIDDDFVVSPRVGREVIITDGLELPNVPELKASAWVTYSWPVAFIQGGEMFLRGQYSYTGGSDNLLIPASTSGANPSHHQESYEIADLRLGLISPDGDWQLDVFANNITDERAEIYQGTGNFEWQFSRTGEYSNFHRTYTNRPREYGLRFTKRWN